MMNVFTFLAYIFYPEDEGTKLLPKRQQTTIPDYMASHAKNSIYASIYVPVLKWHIEFHVHTKQQRNIKFTAS
jgi:hypothetical protein